MFFDTERVGFAGDWHGNTGWALHCLDIFFKRGIKTVYHVGDFGVWGGNDGQSYLRKVNDRLRKHDMLIIVTLGNHENYNMTNKWPLNEEGFQVRNDIERIWIAPRGHLWTHNKARIASLGGAHSIDRQWRRENISWWPQEAITEADVQTLKDNLAAKKWSVVDVFLSHDIPAGLDVGPKQFNLSPEIEYESYRQRILLREAYDMCAPHSGVHGHWHKTMHNFLEGVCLEEGRPFDYYAHVYGLNCDGFNGNIMEANIIKDIGLDDPIMIPWRG